MTVRVLFLGYSDCLLLDFLREQADVFQTMRPIKNNVTSRFDLTISFGYRHILSPQALALAPRPPLNLHISYLPWNRGADPNYWSFRDDTPKGMTIHEMTEKVDAGPIVFREKVEFVEHEDSLARTYQRLFDDIQDLFIEKWAIIRGRHYTIWEQPVGGSYHSVGEMLPLPDGWQTKVYALEVASN